MKRRLKGFAALGAVLAAVACGAAPLLACAAAGQPSAPGSSAATAGATALDRYLDGLMSLRTDFTQTVTDAKGTVEAGTGSLTVQRPGRFRWDYEPQADAGAGAGTTAAAPSAAPPSAVAAAADQRGQLLVADGTNLWFYDRELEQVTVKPIDAALSSTPIMLLSGSAAALRASFEVSAAGMHGGLDWVDVKPRSEQADFSDAQLGFRGGELARMLVHNALGQTVRLDFSHNQRNGHVDAAAFEFKAPPGVDVIGTPQH